MVSVWTARQNIKTALHSLLYPTYADIVRLGLPVELASTQQQKRVYILDVPPNEYKVSPPFEPGSQVRTEDYFVPIRIECESLTGALDGGAANDAAYQIAAGLAWAIFDQIETQVGVDPSWGGVATESGLGFLSDATGPMADEYGTGYITVLSCGLVIRTRGH